MELILANEKDLSRVTALYDACKNKSGTHWRDEYPLESDALSDIAQGGLYLYLDGETLIGAVSAIDVGETAPLAPWAKTDNPCEITRVCLHPARQGQGLCSRMIASLLPVLKARGRTAAQLTVALDVPPAKNAYLRAGFKSVAVVHVPQWDNAVYDCMEIIL